MEIELSKQVKRFLESAKKSDFRIYKLLLDGLQKVKNQDGDIVKIVGQDNLFRLRQGKYRIFFSPDFSTSTIYILEIGKRDNIYRD